ncbi:MAG: PAS domain-containing protein, partial [Gemmatimonadaceae bacterium]
MDAYGKVKAVSGTFASALRIRREELFGQPLPTVARTEDRPALAHAIAAVASGDWPQCSLEVRFLQHGRDDRLVLLHLAADAPQRVRINATDLTTERETRRILQEYESSLRALTAHALDIWGLVNDDGTVRSMSESVSVHLGWTAAELHRAPLFELIHPDDRETARELFVSLKADPQAVRSGVYRVRHKDGGYRTLESTMSGFNPEVFNNSVFVINARDVTARERTEAALREVEYRF